jgi:hypothetical protein
MGYIPHESPQNIEFPCIVDHKDDGAHPMELGSKILHEPVDEIEGLLVDKIKWENTRVFEGYLQWY